MGNTYGYVRVSAKDQNEDRQLIAMLEFGIKEHNIIVEKQSGRDFKRPKYRELVDSILKKNDLFVVKSIDRLGRNYDEILEEWRRITKGNKADIKVLDMPLLDTTINKDLMGTLISDIVLQLLSFVAHNERDIIRQRQAEGIAAARARGISFGRPRKPFPSNFSEVYKGWRDKSIAPADAFALMGLTPKQFYKMVERYERYYS